MASSIEKEAADDRFRLLRARLYLPKACSEGYSRSNVCMKQFSSRGQFRLDRGGGWKALGMYLSHTPRPRCTQGGPTTPRSGVLAIRDLV